MQYYAISKLRTKKVVFMVIRNPLVRPITAVTKIRTHPNTEETCTLFSKLFSFSSLSILLEISIVLKKIIIFEISKTIPICTNQLMRSYFERTLVSDFTHDDNVLSHFPLYYTQSVIPRL